MPKTKVSCVACMYACMLEHPHHFDKRKKKKKKKKEEREKETKREREREVGKLWKGYTIAH